MACQQELFWYHTIINFAILYIILYNGMFQAYVFDW